jgi:serine/threonine protein kinase
MKTTYNGTYTQVDELQNAEGKIILRQKLKEHTLQDAFVRANFLSGARFLQTLKDPTLLTIDEVIETSDEVSIVCKNDGFQQLGVYLANQIQLSDYFLVELIKKMLACLDTLHKNSIFHQGLNPNSFIINAKGDVKLTLFGTLEHRLYHHMPSVGNENPSIQNAVRFYSPERKVNYGAINQESEFYSIGLIIWYLKCVQLNLANTQELVLNFPEYSNTGSVWDKVIEACLQEEPRKRPKSTKDIIGLLPVVASEPIKKIVIPTPPKKVTLSFFNYNSTEYEIKINGTGIENYTTNLEGSKLTIIANEGLEVQVFSKKTGSLISTFNSSRIWQYTLPKVEEGKLPPRPNPTNTSSKKNSQSTLYIIIGVLLLLVLILLFRQCGKNTDASVNASDNATVREISQDTVKNYVPIIITSCSASSFVTSSYGFTYRPENAIDGNMNSWWSPNLNNSDKRIFINLKEASDVHGVKIHGGSHYQNHPVFGNIYNLNVRIKSFNLICYLSNNSVYSKTFNLGDLDELQTIQLNNQVKCDRIEINPISFYPSEKWEDICISEIVVF